MRVTLALSLALSLSACDEIFLTDVSCTIKAIQGGETPIKKVRKISSEVVPSTQADELQTSCVKKMNATLSQACKSGELEGEFTKVSRLHFTEVGGERSSLQLKRIPTSCDEYVPPKTQAQIRDLVCSIKAERNGQQVYNQTQFLSGETLPLTDLAEQEIECVKAMNASLHHACQSGALTGSFSKVANLHYTSLDGEASTSKVRQVKNLPESCANYIGEPEPPVVDPTLPEPVFFELPAPVFPSGYESYRSQCPQGFITREVREEFLGVTITVPPGASYTFCALVPEGQYRNITFESSDISNRNCARMELTIRQESGYQVTLRSGIAGGPSMQYHSSTGRFTPPDYMKTAPGVYFMTIEGHEAPEYCQNSDLSWRAR